LYYKRSFFERFYYVVGYEIFIRFGFKSAFLLALPEDFRTANWIEIIKYPELVYQKSEEYMNYTFAN